MKKTSTSFKIILAIFAIIGIPFILFIFAGNLIFDDKPNYIYLWGLGVFIVSIFILPYIMHRRNKKDKSISNPTDEEPRN